MEALSDAETFSVLIFRLGTVWLALPTGVCKEVAEMRLIHTLPHRHGRTGLGLVNIRGELSLCLALSQFLGLEQSPDLADQVPPHMIYKRLVVAEHGSEHWVFPVDEIAGVEPCLLSAVHDVTASVPPAALAVARGSMLWHEKQVLYLDPASLFTALGRELV